MRALLPQLFLAVAAWSGPATVAAQESTTPFVRLGDRVRIWSAVGRPREGILRRVETDTVLVELPGGATTATIRDGVTRVQVYGGRSFSAGAKRGAKIGAIVGAVVGVGLATGDSGCTSDGRKVPCPVDDDPSAGDRMFLATLTVGLGAAVGSALGAAFPAPTWRDARLPTAEPASHLDVGCRGPASSTEAPQIEGRPTCGMAPDRNNGRVP